MGNKELVALVQKGASKVRHRKWMTVQGVSSSVFLIL